MINAENEKLVLGEVDVMRVVEWHGPFGPAAQAFPDVPHSLWEENQEWLAPDHYEPHTESAVLTLQTWVLRSAGKVVLVDTGMGTGHSRPSSPAFDQWQGGLLDLLAAMGVGPLDVNVV